MAIERTISLEEFAKQMRDLADALPIALINAMEQSLGLIGNQAAYKYMITTSGEGRFVNLTRLTWRSGRLAKSLIGHTFGRSMSPEGKIEVEATDREIRGRLISFVPYAARHEYGGNFKITENQTKYFYYRYKNPGVHDPEMWLALYRKGKAGGSIHTPARPFLGPAIRSDETFTGIRNIIEANFTAMTARLGR